MKEFVNESIFFSPQPSLAVQLGGMLAPELFCTTVFLINCICNCILQLYFSAVFLLGYIPVEELGGQLDPEEPLEFFHFLPRSQNAGDFFPSESI